MNTRLSRLSPAPMFLLLLAPSCSGKDEPRDPGQTPAGQGGAPTSSVIRPLVDCSIVQQDCEGGDFKCTVIQEPAFRPACAASGDRTLGDTCERSAIGDDDCDRGNWCTPLTEAMTVPRVHRCRALCNTNDQCDRAAGERCYQFSLGQLAVLGTCTPECHPLQTTCAEGLHCLPVADADTARFFLCSQYGPLAEGAACATAESCGEGLVCARPEGRCRYFCNAENPCSLEGQTCTPLNQAEEPGLGVCVPG